MFIHVCKYEIIEIFIKYDTFKNNQHKFKCNQSKFDLLLDRILVGSDADVVNNSVMGAYLIWGLGW